MDRSKLIGLFIDDGPVLSSLQFSLAAEGLTTVANEEIPPAGLLVIDQGYRGDGLHFLAGLRETGCAALAVVLVTNPSPLYRVRAANLGANVIEKPLLGDEFSDTIFALLEHQKVA